MAEYRHVDQVDHDVVAAAVGRWPRQEVDPVRNLRDDGRDAGDDVFEEPFDAVPMQGLVTEVQAKSGETVIFVVDDFSSNPA